jgi:hypothetical protein
MPTAVLGFGLWTPGDQFQHEDASVAYDNFRLNSGVLSCPSWWSDNFADSASLRGDDGNR